MWNEQQHSSIAKCSRLRLVFKRQCGICRVLLTAEGANRSTAWLQCKYHPGAGSPATASKWEQAAWKAVQHVAERSTVATESKVLGNTCGPTDLLSPVLASSSIRWVAVEVDGSTHTDHPWDGGSYRERQRQDSEKDAAAWQRQQPVVRLHYEDAHL